jgi:DNA-binding Xre family transcriptional regulator
MEIRFEEQFRDGLNAYIEKKKMRPTALADSAKIDRTAFSKIRKGKRRIFGDEMYAIAHSEGMAIEDIAKYSKN